ncbi:serine/threonine-protein kinase [Luteolibacter sp. AS25]|uniref:serine/threonine-protein kinase n=1 Tax=Luteolibacter sp. AS25 TaxID=3135776 RepID=UPI00398AB1BB
MSGSEYGEDLVACYKCGSAMNVAEIAPYSRVACPGCGAENRVKKQFGPYILNRRHAVGGMSSVFIARDEALDREVALKILSEEFSTDERRIQAFEEEARLTASFSHPYVVRVMATGKAFGRFYIAMEFVTGGHFERVIKDKGRVSELEMLPLAIQIAEGLKGAQAAGLIHRDIKPGNILLDTEGNAKIVDFGLALVTKGGKAKATEIWATPYYVPPEAIEGGEEDFRSDIYAFGATLYHALAGTPPCDEESMSTDKLREAKRRIVPLAEAAPDLLPETCAVIDRAMAYEAANRFGSYDEMIAGLKYALRAAKGEALMGEEVGMSRSETRRRQRRKRTLMISAGSFLLLAAVIVSVIVVNLPEKDEPPARERVVKTNVRTGEATNSSEKIVMQYRSARVAMAKGNTEKACEEFSQLLGNDDVQEPTRSWAGVQAVLTGLISGRTQIVEEVSAITTNHLKTLEGETSESFSGVRDVLRRVGNYEFFKMKDFPEAEGGNVWVASYMIAGLTNWEQGGLDQAVPFFQKVRNSEAIDENGVMGGYQSVAMNYLADYRMLKSGAMSEEPGNRKECREMIEELNRQLTLLKTKGRAKFNVKSRQADLVKLEKTFPRGVNDGPKVEELDLMSEISSLAEGFRLVEIVDLVGSTAQMPEGISRDGLLAVSQSAVVFLDEMRADLERRPVALELILRDGSEIDSIVVTTDGQLMGRELSGDARELVWGDFPEDQLIKLHRVLVKSPTTELERLRRNESAISFDWLVGDRDRANEAAARLSASNEDFRKRWVYLMGADQVAVGE